MLRRGAVENARQPGALPEGTDAATLKKEFKLLAAQLHPDRAGADGDAVAKFQHLSAEYQRLLAKCKTADQRDTLRRGWLSVGGVTAVAAAAISEPALAVALAGSLGSVALVSAIVDFIIPPTTAEAAAPLLESVERDEPMEPTLPQLYTELDQLIEQGAYLEARRVKDLIDQRVAAPPLGVSAVSSATAKAVEATAKAAVEAAMQAVKAKAASARAAEEAAAAAAAELQVARAEAEARFETLTAKVAEQDAAAGRVAAAEAEAEVVAEGARSGYSLRHDLPETLEAWGCDQELWSATKNKKGLLDLARKGDEARGRARIQRLREMIRRDGGEDP